MNRVVLVWAALCAAPRAMPRALCLDTSFRSTIVKKNVNSILVMEDGKVIVSGKIYFPGDPPWDEKAGARLYPDGSRDMSFNTYAQMGGKLTRWSDRIYVQNGNGVRRLWLDGVRDTTFITISQGPYFNLGQGGDYYVYPDGRVLMSGLHGLEDTIRGYTGLHSLIWFSNTGYLDTTQHHRKCNNAIYTLAVEPGGQLLVSGIYSTYEGQPAPCILRLHPDGERDTTFNVPFVWGMATAITPLPGGRMLASGYFLPNVGNDTLQFVRLLPDGSLDSTFNNVLNAPRDLFGAYGGLWHTVLPDDRLVLHGNFSSVDGEPRSGIALLDSNGHLSNDAFTGDGCGIYDDGFYPLHATAGMVPDQNGNWYIYGAYIGCDDGTTNDPQQRFVSRLYGLDVGVWEREEPLQVELFPNPAHTSTTVRWARPGSYQLRLLDVTGREVYRSAHQGTEAVLDLAGLPAGPYVIQITDQTHRRWSRTLIVEP